MKNSFIFDGMNSSDFGVWISGTETYTAPERDVEYVSVPGRNGDLIIDNGRWRNVPLTYPAYIDSDFPDKANQFKNMMCLKTGYRTLEDSYHPEEYRMAQFTGGFEPKTGQFNRNASFDINFICKPQRFLKSGTTPVQLLLPTFTGTTYSTSVIPVAGDDLTVTAHCQTSITVKVYTYDSSFTQLRSSTYTMSDGSSNTFSFQGTDIYWKVEVSNYSDADSTSVTIQTVTEYDGKQIKINAPCGRNVWLSNPTGYYARPLFEVYNDAIFDFTIYNYTNGVQDELFDMKVDEIPNCTHFWVDCELQYLYDDDKTNLTSYLSITDAESNVGESLVFPGIGQESRLRMYASSSAAAHGLGLVQIYPRWWRL